jgi:hypothetical protein
VHSFNILILLNYSAMYENLMCTFRFSWADSIGSSGNNLSRRTTFLLLFLGKLAILRDIS